jgi:hypothetical protein
MIHPGAKATVIFGVAKKFPPFENVFNFMIPRSLKEKKSWHSKYAVENMERGFARHDAPLNLWLLTLLSYFQDRA